MTVTIEFDVPVDAFVRVGMYDASGLLVALLVNQYLEAGLNAVDFDAGDLSSGCYNVQIAVGNRLTAHKMLLVK